MATYGLREVYKGENAAVDIVFVHGLCGSREGTWTKDGILWSAALLAKDIEGSCIYLFGYDSDITHRDQTNVPHTELEDNAEDLCAKLVAQRSLTDATGRSLIFIAHSLGGLVCAEVVVMGARRASGDNASVIAQCTKGMVFFGTPFRGSKLAQPVEIARKILNLFGAKAQEHTLTLLGVDSQRLKVLNTAFPETMSKRNTSNKPEDGIDAMFFYETLPTHGRMVVEPESATIPGCGASAPIRANHLDMCKFKTAEDDGYQQVVSEIRKFIARSKEVMPTKGGDKIINNYGKAMNINNEAVHISSQYNSL